MQRDVPTGWTPQQRAVVTGILTDVIAMTPDLPGDRPLSARAAARLLLDHTCPWLSAEERADLARTCELAASRHSA